MKKFFKFLLALIAIGAVVAGGIYLVKNVLMKDYLDDYDDDDFDNDLYDEDDDDDDREYVTINNASEDKEEEDSVEE